MLGWVQQHLVLPWTALLARICAALVTWFDSTAAASGNVLWNQQTGFGVSIEPGCNGIEACIVLFAAVQALIMLDVLVVWLLWVRAGSRKADAPPPQDPPAPPSAVAA